MIIPVFLVVVALSLTSSAERLDFACGPVSAEQEQLRSCVLNTIPTRFGRMMNTCAIAAGQASFTATNWSTIMCTEPMARIFRLCMTRKTKAAGITLDDIKMAVVAAEQICIKASE